MKWYHYVAAFFAGAFLTNVIPHLVHGVSGDAFTSPFASPPGKGLSSPLVNVLWACINLLAGYILLRVSRLTARNKLAMFIFFLGIVAMAVQLALVLGDKVKV